MKKECKRDGRRFLEEFTNSVLSTVAARSKIGQDLRCFCPAIIIGGDDHASLHLLGLLLDGLFEGGGSRAMRSRLVGLNTSHLSKSNDNWSSLQRGADVTYVTSCRFPPSSLVFALASICLKYVS